MRDTPETEFQYNGKIYDFSFNKDYVGLYLVLDKLSETIVSKVMEAANDFVAVQSFLKMKEDLKDKNDLNVYELVRGGYLNLNNGTIIAEKMSLFDTRDDLQAFLKAGKDKILATFDKEV